MSVTGREWRRPKQNKNHVMWTIFLVNLSATNIDEMQVNIQWGIFWDDADVADVIIIIHSEKNVDDWEVLPILNLTFTNVTSIIITQASCNTLHVAETSNEWLIKRRPKTVGPRSSLKWFKPRTNCSSLWKSRLLFFLFSFYTNTDESIPHRFCY